MAITIVKREKARDLGEFYRQSLKSTSQKESERKKRLNLLKFYKRVYKQKVSITRKSKKKAPTTSQPQPTSAARPTYEPTYAVYQKAQYFQRLQHQPAISQPQQGLPIPEHKTRPLSPPTFKPTLARPVSSASTLHAERYQTQEEPKPKQQFTSPYLRPIYKESAEKLRAKGYMDVLRGHALKGETEQALAGFAKPFASAIDFSLLVSPIYPKETRIKTLKTTGKQIGFSVIEVGRRLKTGRNFPEVGQSLRQETPYAVGVGAAEYGIMKATEPFIEVGSTKVSDLMTTIGRKKIPVEGSQVLLEEPVILVESSQQAQLPLKEQVRMVSEQRTIRPVSAQRENIFGLIKSKEVVEKPKPTPYSSELERSYFADPTNKVRLSRLGLEPGKRATLLEYQAGEFSTRSRPAIHIFPEQTLEEFPQEIKPIAEKISKGAPLTPSELEAFRKWQLTPSGKFKGIGYIGSEAEVTLAPGEVIKRTERLGYAKIKGRPVQLEAVEVIQPSRELESLIYKKATKGLTKEESSTFRRLFKEETGYSYEEYISRSSSKPYLNIESRIISRTFIPTYGLKATYSEGRFSSATSLRAKTPTYSGMLGFPSGTSTSGKALPSKERRPNPAYRTITRPSIPSISLPRPISSQVSSFGSYALPNLPVLGAPILPKTASPLPKKRKQRKSKSKQTGKKKAKTSYTEKYEPDVEALFIGIFGKKPSKKQARAGLPRPIPLRL